MENNFSEIVLYQSEDGVTKIEVTMEDETVWLTQAQMVELFQSSKSNISEHIKHIFSEGELEEDSVVRNFRTTAIDGKKYNKKHYNLDVIISVGYRVKSLRGTQFRKWALQILKEYLIKGFAMNDDLLKEVGGGTYWKELLNRIRDIRSSEKVFYRQVLDLYATSVDYDPKTDESQLFFKIVQNKIHYAAHKQTASEVVYNRVDSTLPYMGLTSFKGEQPVKSEVKIAKNYLNEEELTTLNTMVGAFFDLAELMAMRKQPMYMKDWIQEVDDFAQRYGNGILKGKGSVSSKQAENKAFAEYEKYKKIINEIPTEVEKVYIENLKVAEEKLKNKK